MSVVSNGQFWMYTFALFIFWIIVLTTAFNFDTNVNNKLSLPSSNAEDELKSTGNCKSLCKQCRCMGFFCGEECICECNTDHSDTECIRRIQENAQKLNISYEILIQGPKANNFVRNALQFEQNGENKLAGYRDKRSTITVYKPNKGKNNRHPKSPIDLYNLKNTPIKDIFNVTKKVKRSSNHYDWFNDLRNNLLRPAPLSGRKRKVEEPTKNPKISKIPSLFDNSWIFDNNGVILTPKPLKNRKSSNILSSSNHENKVDSSSMGTISPKKFKKKFNDDFADSPDKLKSGKMKAKNSFLAEQTNKREESQENLIGSLYSRLFKNDFGRTDESSSNLAENKKNQDESHDSFPLEQNKRLESEENLIGSLYSRLFKNDLSRTDDSSSILSENKKNEEKSHDYGLGDLSEIEDDNNLFSEEKEEEKVTKKLKTTKNESSASNSAQVLSSSPADVKGVFPKFRFPWFRPGKLFGKFRRVINA